MSKYTIIQNGRTITPPENISQIYHGAHLIWERTKKTGKIFIEKIFESAALYGKKFTKNGLIVPDIIINSNPVCFNLEGKKMPLNIEVANGEAFWFVWGDVPAYKITQDIEDPYGGMIEQKFSDYMIQQPDGNFSRVKITPEITDTESQWETVTDKISANVISRYIKDFSDYMIQQPDGNFSRVKITPEITDTESQWETVTDKISANVISRYIKDNPTTIAPAGGNGIFPMSRPLGFCQGDTKIRNFSYIQDGKIVSNPDFVVIGVFGDSILCGENLLYQGSYVIGDITVRDKNFSYIRTIISQYQISEPYTEPSENFYPREFNYCGNYLFYRKYNLTTRKYETFKGGQKLNINVMPYCIAYANDTFFYLNDDYKKTLYYTENGTIKNMPFRDSTTGEQFTMANTWETTGGAYYVDGDGSLYVIAETEKRDIYALVRITRR